MGRVEPDVQGLLMWPFEAPFNGSLAGRPWRPTPIGGFIVGKSLPTPISLNDLIVPSLVSHIPDDR